MTGKTAVTRSIDRVDGNRQSVDDHIAVEEPLEIRVAGETVAVTMRTPGDDRWLTAGFLIAEGIVSDVEELSRSYHCGSPAEEGYGNTIDVLPAAGVVLPLDRTEASRRGTLTTAACGVCGRLSIEDLEARCEPVEPGPQVSAKIVSEVIDALRTGGVHAAGLADSAGHLFAVCEDIGRHNAVDKVVGGLALGESNGHPVILVVSGRASFEIVQKAAASRVPVVASVSAASSLAVDLAERLGITLIGFVRGGRMNIYTHQDRVSE